MDDPGGMAVKQSDQIELRAIPRRPDIKLSVLGFGGAAIGGLFSAVSADQAQETIAAALDEGICYFDTAPFYGRSLSEARLGRALPARGIALSTKVGRRLRQPLPEEPIVDEGFVGAPDLIVEYDYSGSGVRASVEASLARLARDRLDVVLVHDPGPTTHGKAYPAILRQLLDEALPVLAELQAQEVIGAIGLGVNETQVCLDVLGHADLDVLLLANRYTLLEQNALNDLLSACSARQVGVIIGGPFNSGLTATADAPGDTYEYGTVPETMLARARAIYRVAERHAVDVGGAALQMPLAHPAVLSVIPGARSAAEVRTNVARFHAPIPPGFWSDLQGAGLLAEGVPLP